MTRRGRSWTQAPPHPVPPLDTDAIRRSFAAWNAGDFDGWLAEAAPDPEYSPGIVIGPAEGERVVYRGRDELRRFFDEWHSTWKTDLTILEIEEVAGRVLISGRMQMTGIQSGATVEQEVAWIADVDGEGRLRSLRSYPTPETARDAISELS
jgi:ketosteroid isomerase-like protein